jgi:hypothetical protein
VLKARERESLCGCLVFYALLGLFLATNHQEINKFEAGTEHGKETGIVSL